MILLIKMSVHKNYVEWYWSERDALCTQKLLPYQNEVFKLLSDKFYTDAENDREKWRKLLTYRWYRCSELCNEIHKNFEWSDVIGEDLKGLVNDIVNMDYNSLLEVFQTLKDEYSEGGNQWVSNQINYICEYLEKMWNVSKKHTEIKSL